MEYAADLADPLVDIRDVVESFRACHLVLPDWDQTLRQASAALRERRTPDQVDAVLPGLLPNLGVLLAQGLRNAPHVVNAVADQVAAVLAETPTPGIPSPDDDDWAFGHG